MIYIIHFSKKYNRHNSTKNFFLNQYSFEQHKRI